MPGRTVAAIGGIALTAALAWGARSSLTDLTHEYGLPQRSYAVEQAGRLLEECRDLHTRLIEIDDGTKGVPHSGRIGPCGRIERALDRAEAEQIAARWRMQDDPDYEALRAGYGTGLGALGLFAVGTMVSLYRRQRPQSNLERTSPPAP